MPPPRASPIAAQIVRSRIASLMEEMHHHFYRSGYSTIVRESRDFSCVVLDPAGRLLVAPPMFLHGPVYHHLVARILALYGEAGLKDGDVILCNHPYEGQLPHAPDMAVVAPIRFAGRLAGFAGSIAHKADIGGAVPGSLSGQATEIFQEGLLLPPVKLYDAGRRNLGLERLIAANSRAPALVLGDLEAQIGATRLGVAGVRALCQSHGAAALEHAFAAIFRAAVASFRAALQRLPHGRAEAEGFLDSDGVRTGDPVRLAVAVTIDADGIALDFTGCAAMARGPVNLRPALVEACAYYALIAFLDPELPYNDGLAEVVRFRYPPNSVVNAAAPAPVGSYIMTCHKLVDVVLKALGQLDPARAIAESGGTGGAITLTWKDRVPDGNFHQYEIHGSAYGATAQGDGASGLTVHLANIHATPIEIVESEFPCRITRFELIPDSGGAGRWRGGLSFRRAYRVGEAASLTYRADRARFAPEGIAGGGPGRASRLVLDQGGQERVPGPGRVELAAGDSFAIEGAGGGGAGPPAARDPARRAADLSDGYVGQLSSRAEDEVFGSP